MGGRVYLHQTKSAASYFGGEVLSYRFADGEEAGRVILQVRSDEEGKGAVWRGRGHGMAWTSGLVEEA